MWTLLRPTVLIGEVTAHNFSTIHNLDLNAQPHLYQQATRVEVQIVVANTAVYLRSNLISQLERIE